VIKSFQGGGERFVYAPRARFSVDLIDSFVSTRTTIASQAPIFDTVYGLGSPDGMLQIPTTPSVPGTVQLPSPNTGGSVGA
jgi:hypothetical protein